MSVNPDDMNMASGVAEEFVDLEHQIIRQQVDLPPTGSEEQTPGDAGAEFDPGERQLDREEVAQLVAYRRYASVGYNDPDDSTAAQDATILDASVGINGDLFREVTTEQTINSQLSVDTGGEIGLLDNYELAAIPNLENSANGYAAGGQYTFSELIIPFYDWPTGGPIVDSFDTITCGFKADNNSGSAQSEIELRYDFWWDVAEQGRSTNPFGRPSTR